VFRLTASAPINKTCSSQLLLYMFHITYFRILFNLFPFITRKTVFLQNHVFSVYETICQPFVFLNHVTDFEETRYKLYGRRSTLQRRTFQLRTPLRTIWQSCKIVKWKATKWISCTLLRQNPHSSLWYDTDTRQIEISYPARVKPMVDSSCFHRIWRK